jgi:hypothetical protein
LCIQKSLESLPSGSFLGPFGVFFSGNWRSELDSIRYPGPSYFMQKVIVLLLFVFSVLYKKKIIEGRTV